MELVRLEPVNREMTASTKANSANGKKGTKTNNKELAIINLVTLYLYKMIIKLAISANNQAPLEKVIATINKLKATRNQLIKLGNNFLYTSPKKDIV